MVPGGRPSLQIHTPRQNPFSPTRTPLTRTHISLPSPRRQSGQPSSRVLLGQCITGSSLKWGAQALALGLR